MDNKPDKYYAEWWNIRKSTIYLAAAFLVFLIVLGGGGWAWRAGYFQTTPEETVAPKDAAQITSFEGDVRVVRAATRETMLVTRATYVSAGDTIQTQADGRAQVQMIDGSVLSIRPNSTVVIRDSASIFGGTNVRVTLDDGQINVKTQDKTETSENVVEMKESESELAAQTDASFNINEETAGGEIRISRGSVEANTGGAKVLVKEGEFAAVANGKIAARERLLAAPKLIAPEAAAQTNAGAEISFRWLKPEANSPVSYNFQAARSPFFAENAIEAAQNRINNQILNRSDFSAGVYYWRVQALTVSGQASDWSEPRKFTVVKASGGETITADSWQVERIGGNIYRIAGRTQSGTDVRAVGRTTFADASGAFTLQISSASPNVAAEFSDERGNRSRYNLSLATGNAVKVN